MSNHGAIVKRRYRNLCHKARFVSSEREAEQDLELERHKEIIRALKGELNHIRSSRAYRLAVAIQALKAKVKTRVGSISASISKSAPASADSLSTHVAKSTLRIAYLIPGRGISGGTAVVLQHLNRLKERGFETFIIDTMNQSGRLDWFPNQQVEIRSLEEIPHDLDVAVATGWQTVHHLEGMAAHQKYYFVQSDETRFTDDPDTKAYIRATYEKPFKYFTEARWIQRWLKAEFGHDSFYAPNGLDPELIHPTVPLTPRGERLRVLLEGPIGIPFKGMADAFAAVGPLDCEIWCVSSYRPPRPSWRCDRFFQAVPLDQMKFIYSSCDILLKMSRVEGFFGPPLEMMACGGVPVVSKVTGYDEYIVDGENALVVEMGDVRGAREAVRCLLEDGDLRARLQEGGRQTAALWRWKETIDHLERAFTLVGNVEER